MSKTSLGSSLSSGLVNSSKISGGPNRQDDFLPLLYIPGVLSSGLEVQKSCVHERYVGERVWLNPLSLAEGKLRLGKSFTIAEGSKSKVDDESSDESEDDEEEEAEIVSNSPWLQHLSLTSDMMTEREGNEIRPIPGLDGVDFLTDIADVNIGMSYVFAPIMKLLKGIGYVEGRNFDAVPYDWRIPPSVLEERDGYFTKTMERIEKMYQENDGKPVVLLCHSMGAKTGHYLLNFALEKLGAPAGREWLDKHIHTYMPLGAPHLGCPNIFATTFTGGLHDILNQMLSEPERLFLARSFGSGVWLMPTLLPSFERNAPPAVFCKPEGRLIVTILATEENPLGDLRKLVTTKHGTRKVKNIKIKVSYGDKKTDKDRSKIRSGKAIPVSPPANNKSAEDEDPDAQYVAFPCPKFIFPTPPSLLEGKETLKPLRFTICERGNIRAHDVEPQNKALDLLGKIDIHRRLPALLLSTVANKRGVYKTNLGMSSPIEDIDVHELVAAGETGLTINVPIVARTDMTLLGMIPKEKSRSIDMKVNIKWEPPASNEGDDFSYPLGMIPKASSSEESSPYFAPIPTIQSTETKDENTEYIPLSGQAMLKAECLDEGSFGSLARDKYSASNDPVDPLGRSSFERPPVKRTYAIYGINLDTEVSTICKQVPCYHEDETPQEMLLRPRYEVDTEARFAGADDSKGEDKEISASRSGHKMEKGYLLEHSGTPQMNLLTGERIHCSGDGTVPYYCLQQPQVWAKELMNDPKATEAGERVMIKEIEGAEHREILQDKQFHTLLVDYLRGNTPVVS